jgi:hypothetical protein
MKSNKNKINKVAGRQKNISVISSTMAQEVVPSS